MSANAWLFPGHGSQYAGMGRGFAFDNNEVARIFAIAESLSEQPLQQLSKSGSAQIIQQPHVLEPLLTAFALSYIHLLHDNDHYPSAVAGYSAGIIPALYCAGIINLNDALNISVSRGKLLNDLIHECQGQIITLSGSDKKSLLSFIASSPYSSNIEIAGWNTENCLSIVGSYEAISSLAILSTENNIKAAPVATAAAWHSYSASKKYQQFLESLSAITFSTPQIPFYSSVTGCKESCTKTIALQLAAQVHLPVLWQATLSNMEANEAIEHYLEVGCGMSLKSMQKSSLQKNTSPDFKNIYSYIGATYA